MIGLVVVSHSRQLALGVAELAGQMAPTVAIVPCGGAGDGLGTDYAAVVEALAAADSGDGVVVLFDLGSARMVADMAAEEAGGPVLVVDAPLVEGAVAAAVRAQGGASLEQVAAAAASAYERFAPSTAPTTPTAPTALPGASVGLLADPADVPAGSAAPAAPAGSPAGPASSSAGAPASQALPADPASPDGSAVSSAGSAASPADPASSPADSAAAPTDPTARSTGGPAAVPLSGDVPSPEGAVRAEVVLTNEVGLHARPAALVVRALDPLDASVVVRFGAEEADGKSVLALMGLGAPGGATVEVVASGADAAEAVRRFEELAARRFDE